MAVYAAHLTRTLQGLPSVFEVVAQSALATTVKPALRNVFLYLAEKDYSYNKYVEWYDELYLLFDCFLQYHYLKHYAASFSESFYGLTRVQINGSAEFDLGQRLPVTLERASLVLLVLVPYLRDKVEKILERWKYEVVNDRKQKLRNAAVRVYGVLHCSCELAQLMQLAAYMSGRSAAHGPALRALGLALRKAPPPPPRDHTLGEFVRNVLTGNWGSAVLTFPMAGEALLRGVEYGAFAVQLARWWAEQGRPAAAALPAPDPVQPRYSQMRWKNRCYVCKGSLRIPTVLPVSGWVFCYTCISRYVRDAGACPATRLPAAERELVRLYPRRQRPEPAPGR